MGDIGGFGAKSSGKKASRSATRQRRNIRKLGKPEKFVQNYQTILEGLGGYGEPERRQFTDLAALGEQTEMQGLDADAARRGLSGSGYHLAGRGAIRGGRQARVNEALTRLYQQKMGLAAGEAGAGIRATQGAIAGVPNIGYPSGGAVASQTVGDLLGLWLAFGGGGTDGGKGGGGYSGSTIFM